MKKIVGRRCLGCGLAALMVLGVLSAEAGYRKGELLWMCDFTSADQTKYKLDQRLGGDGCGSTLKANGGRDGDGAMLFRTKSKAQSAKIAIVPDVKFSGVVQIEADVRGVELGKGEHDFNGPKVMFPHRVGKNGRTNYPQLPSEYGSFDWKTWIMVYNVDSSAEDFCFVLGLENAPGELWIDSVRVYRAEEVADDPSAPAPFNAAAAKIPRGRFQGTHNPKARRGVMSGGDMDEESIRNLADWGANLIRLQIGVGSCETMDEYFEKFAKRLDWAQEVMDRCAKYDIQACIDLHGPPNCTATKHASNVFPEDYDTAALCRAWRMIAKRFKDHPMTYAYDIANEPSCSPATWDRVFRDAMKAVREIDPKTPFVTETPKFWYEGENVIYSPHYYSPHTLTHFGVGGNGKVRWSYPGYIDGVYWDKEQMRVVLEPWIRLAEQHPEAKILVGEFSCILWSKGADRYIRDCIELFEEYGWDWTYHAYREWPPWDVEYTDDGKLTVGKTIRAKTDTKRKQELVKGLRYNQCID